MTRRFTPMYLHLLRSILVAVLIFVLFHILADYFGWHLYREAGGGVV
jgi:hypothetical protein